MGLFWSLVMLNYVILTWLETSKLFLWEEETEDPTVISIYAKWHVSEKGSLRVAKSHPQVQVPKSF